MLFSAGVHLFIFLHLFPSLGRNKCCSGIPSTPPHFRRHILASRGRSSADDVEPEEEYDYNDYKENAQSHADILHQYFKHFNHKLNSQPPHYYEHLERKDKKNRANSPANLFSGDIGEDSDLIKRDLATQQEPSSSEMKATVTPL